MRGHRERQLKSVPTSGSAMSTCLFAGCSSNSIAANPSLLLLVPLQMTPSIQAVSTTVLVQVLDVSRAFLEALPEGSCAAEDYGDYVQDWERPRLHRLPTARRLRRLVVIDSWLADNLVLLDCLPSLRELHLTGKRSERGIATHAQWDALLGGLVGKAPSLEVLKVAAYNRMCIDERIGTSRISLRLPCAQRPTLQLQRL